MKKIFIIILALIILTIPINIVLAAGDEDTPADGSPNTVTLPNPLGKGKTDVSLLMGDIIAYALGIIGSLALVMIIYGGATWMLSGGNQEKVSKGKSTIIWAALGLAIIFTSYALVTFVIRAISGATTP